MRMINKISFPNPLTAARIGQKKRSSGVGDTSFSSLLDGVDESGDVNAPETVNTAAPLSNAGMLLGLQEVSEDEVERKRAIKKGRSMIDVLDQLRDALLVGSLSPATIRQLETVLAERRATITDPRLSAILDEIEVRAAVELAKLERAGFIAPRDAGA